MFAEYQKKLLESVEKLGKEILLLAFSMEKER